MEDDRTLADRLALVVQYRLAVARGQLLGDDLEGGLDTLRYFVTKDLAALAAELESDLVREVSGLTFKWASEAACLARTLNTPMGREWRDAMKASTPAGADFVALGRKVVVLADRRVRVDVTPITRALAFLKAEGTLHAQLAKAIESLWGTGALITVEHAETFATWGGNGHHGT